MEGFIVLHRKLLEWGWYDNTNMVRLWVHLLLRANFKDISWHGQIIKRGQFITGLEELAHQTGLSLQKTRTCLDRLIECGCITKKSTNKYTIITICKYSDYQDLPEENNKQITNKQQTNNKEITTSKQRNKETRYNTHTICAREEEFFDEAFRNETWREAIRMRHKLTEQQVSDLWEEYKLHSRASNKAHESARDIQEHFNLWILSRNKRHGTDNRDYNSDEARAARLEGAAQVMRELYENGKQYYREVPDH